MSAAKKPPAVKAPERDRGPGPADAVQLAYHQADEPTPEPAEEVDE